MRVRMFMAFALAASACGGDTGDDTTCLDADALATLDEHAAKMRASGALASGHPASERRSGSFCSRRCRSSAATCSRGH